jgi:hypothetical protein
MREIAPPRELTENESELLEFLLSAGFAGRDELRRQAAVARVSGEDPPSIRLVVETGVAPPAKVTRRIPIEAEGTDRDGAPLHSLLHVVDGYLGELEVFREDGQPVLDLPAPAALTLFSLDEPEA